MIDPLPDLGKRLPPELYRELMTAPPILTVREAAAYMKMSEERVRVRLRQGKLAGSIRGAHGGAEKCLIPRSALLQYFEQRYLESRRGGEAA